MNNKDNGEVKKILKSIPFLRTDKDVMSFYFSLAEIAAKDGNVEIFEYLEEITGEGFPPICAFVSSSLLSYGSYSSNIYRSFCRYVYHPQIYKHLIPDKDRIQFATMFSSQRNIEGFCGVISDKSHVNKQLFSYALSINGCTGKRCYDHLLMLTCVKKKSTHQ